MPFRSLDYCVLPECAFSSELLDNFIFLEELMNRNRWGVIKALNQRAVQVCEKLYLLLCFHTFRKYGDVKPVQHRDDVL